MKNFSRILFLLVAVSMILCVTACGKKETEKETETFETVELQTEEKEEPAEEVSKTPEHVNPLSGAVVDASQSGKRPIGFMFNNKKEALPQVGLSKCDIIYEAIAEGGIPRLEGLIYDYANAGDLGSVRSARTYYVNIARAYDAIFIHAGAHYLAGALLKNTGIDHFDGVNNADGCRDARHSNFTLENGHKLYWRNQTRLNSGYSLEHTMFSNGADIAQAIKERGYRTTLNDAKFTAFNFDYEFGGIGSGKTANYIKLPHSSYFLSEFNYDASTGLYAHTHYNRKHVDGATGEQIKVDNVFVLFTKQSRLNDGTSGLDITLTGEGKGYYANGGEYVEIIWKHASEDVGFKYYTTDGNELKVETGKSYVVIFDEKNASSVAFS